MDLADRQPPGNRRADAGRGRGVESIHVEAQMEAPRPVEHQAEALVDDRRDAAPVHLLHRVDPRPERRHHRGLPGVHAPRPDHHRVRRRQTGGSGRESPDAGQRLRPLPQNRGQRHAVEVPARRRLRGVGISVGVDPEEPDRLALAALARQPRHPRNRPQCDRVIAAEHHRQPPGEPDPPYPFGERLENPGDLGEVAGVLVSGTGERLDHRGGEVALVDDLAPQAPDLPHEAGVPHRRRPHVHPATAGAEVERNPDDGHRSAGRHGDILHACEHTPHGW